MKSIFFNPLNLDYYRTEPVVARADCHALMPSGVNPIIKIPTVRAVGKRKNMLIYRLPCLIAEPIGLGVIGVEDLPLLHERTPAEVWNAVLLCKILLESSSENCKSTLLHHVDIPALNYSQ